MNRSVIWTSLVTTILLCSIHAFGQMTKAEAEAAARKAVSDIYAKKGVEAASCIYKGSDGSYNYTTPAEGTKTTTPQHTCPSTTESIVHSGEHEGTMSSMDLNNPLKSGIPSTAVNNGSNGGHITYDPREKTLTITDVKNQTIKNYEKNCDQLVPENGYDGWENTAAYLKGDAKANAHWGACVEGIVKVCDTISGICEEKEVMSAKNREKKMKKAESERKATEAEERLRQQQQLDEQRKNKDVKKSDKKESDKKKNSKDHESTTDSKPSRDVSIDFSVMESCLNQQISIVRSILNSGEKATDAQVSKLNSLVNKYKSEKTSIQSKINGISDSAKRAEALSRFNAIESRKQSVLVPLRQEAAQRHLFQNGSL